MLSQPGIQFVVDRRALVHRLDGSAGEAWLWWCVVFPHWSSMILVRPGDVIFSYAPKSIGAIGVASSD